MLFSLHKLLPFSKSSFSCYSGPDEAQVARAKVLTEDLLEVVRSEHAKAAQAAQQQQMELRQAQAAYAAYTASYTVRLLRRLFLSKF